MLRAAALLGLLTSLWPGWISDPVEEARGCFESPAAGPAEAEDRAARALQAAPRRAALHCWRGRAAEARDASPVLHDRRALRAQPHHPAVGAESGRRLLRVAAQRGDASLRREVLPSLPAALEAGEIDLIEAALLLELAGASSSEWCVLAARDPERTQRLLEQRASRGDVEGTCALGAQLDRLRGQGDRTGAIRARVRLAKAAFARGEAEDAVDFFAQARELVDDAADFALDEADALLAAGRFERGVPQLLAEARRLELGAARIAGPCYQSPDPLRALRVLEDEARTPIEAEAVALLRGWCGGLR